MIVMFPKLILRTCVQGRLRAVAFVAVVTACCLWISPDGPAGGLVYAQTPDFSVQYAENGTGPVAALRAGGQGEVGVQWTLSGPDDDLFTISDGVLRFRQSPNYEDPQSASGTPLPYRSLRGSMSSDISARRASRASKSGIIGPLFIRALSFRPDR